MRLLKVPLYLQDPGSVDCGPVCSRMMLEYFGINRSLDELREKVKYEAVGTSAYDNGSIFLAEGLKRTAAVTAHPMLFPPDLMPKLADKQELLARIDAIAGRSPEEKVRNLATLRKFLGLGGQIIMEIPSFRHIKEAIDDGSPVLALTYARALGENQGGFHFIIANGYKRNFVHITNPSPLATNRGWFPLDRFLFAVHCCTTSDLDNGTLIVPRW